MLWPRPVVAAAEAAPIELRGFEVVGAVPLRASGGAAFCSGGFFGCFFNLNTVSLIPGHSTYPELKSAISRQVKTVNGCMKPDWGGDYDYERSSDTPVVLIRQCTISFSLGT